MLLAALSAFSWNLFFIPPLFTLYIAKAEDWIMFGMFFIVAISMGSLDRADCGSASSAERARQGQTSALLRVTQSAALAAEPEKGLAEALRTIDELLVRRHGTDRARAGPLACRRPRTRPARFQPTSQGDGA